LGVRHARAQFHSHQENVTMKRASTISVFLILLFAIAVSAQAQIQMSKPGPELKKLDFLAGIWTMDGELKPSPMGGGGKITGTDQIEWMDGGYFLVWHSKVTSGVMGNFSATAYMGYNTNDKVYTYDDFNSMGEAEHSKGTIDGDIWTWVADEKVGGTTVKGRYTMKILSPKAYSFKFEMSEDGTSWTTVMDGKSTKN
jgi:hypothetical protein